MRINILADLAYAIGKKEFYIHPMNKLLHSYDKDIKCKITENDVLWFDEYTKHWYPLKGDIYDLITGHTDIKKEKDF